MRARPPIVSGIVLFVGKAHRHEAVGIVANDVPQQLRRPGCRILDSVDCQLPVGVSRGGGKPADASISRSFSKSRIPGGNKLVGIALEQNDVLARHSDKLEIADRFKDNLLVRDRLRQIITAVAMAVWIHFDANHVAGFEESLPRFVRLIRAGQRTHSFIHHRLTISRSIFCRGTLAFLSRTSTTALGDALQRHAG
jgi:hypothetical protein